MTAEEPVVFVIDDEPSVRKSLGRLLRAAGHRVEVFSSAREFLETGRGDEDGCLVLDVRMPDLDGMQLQEALAAADSPMPIVFITGHGDIPTSVKAMKAGATDFLSKPLDEEELLDAVGRALAKLDRESSRRAGAHEAKRRLAGLTSREREVLLHVLAGRLNKQIAAALGISEKTVKTHRGRLMGKMQVRSVADLVRICERAGIRLP